MKDFSSWLRSLPAKIQAGLYRFMSGRYGTDRLNVVILCFFAGQLGWPDFLRVELCADDFGHLAQPLPEYQQALSGEQTLLLDAGSGEGSQEPLFSLPPLSPDRPRPPGQGQDYDYLPQVQGKIPAKNLTA